MANNAYLINSEIFSNSIEELKGKEGRFTVLATGSNRIPVAWFFCFDHDDLKPAEFIYRNNVGEEVSFKFQAPCVAKEKALSNITSSKELFIEFCGDEVLGKEYWAKAVSDIEDIEYPYISLHPLEVFYLNDPEDDAIEFNKCFTRTPQSFPSIKLLSFYQKGHLPYGLVEFYANSRLGDQSKIKNSAALDMGIKGVDTSSWVKPQEIEAQEVVETSHGDDAGAQAKKPWWKIW